MTKFWKITGIALVLVIALGLIGAASTYAQGPSPDSGSGPLGPCHEAGLLDIDPDAMHAAIAEALGISVAEFEAARADGAPLYRIAQQLGIDIEVVREAMRDVREAAIEDALEAGVITEAQAERLLSRPGPGGYGYGYGFGQGQGMQHQGRQHHGKGYGAGNGYGQGMMFGQR